MRTKLVSLSILSLATIGTVGYFTLSADAQTVEEKAATTPEPSSKRTARQNFMDGKMNIAQEILRGVVLRDFDRMKKGAVALNVLTLAEEWSSNNTKEYDRMSEDLRRSCRQLSKAASEKDAFAANLAYQRMTQCCIECHAALLDGFE